MSTIAKTLCPVHRFMYAGRTCPFCESDRINKMASRHAKKQEAESMQKKQQAKQEQNNEPVEVTSEQLAALKAKFGCLH